MEKYEVVKQLDYALNGVFIKGKIVKDAFAEANDEYPFSWEISHYCAVEGEFDPYTPSNRMGRTVEEAERGLDNYVKRFESYTSIRENNNF